MIVRIWSEKECEESVRRARVEDRRGSRVRKAGK